MTIKKEISIGNFEAWGGAEEVLRDFANNQKLDELDAYLEDVFPNGVTEEELNDFLQENAKSIYKDLDVKTIDEELQEEMDYIDIDNFEIKMEMFFEDVESYFDEDYEGDKAEDFSLLYTDDYNKVKTVINDFKNAITQIESEYNEDTLDNNDDYKRAVEAIEQAEEKLSNVENEFGVDKEAELEKE